MFANKEAGILEKTEYRRILPTATNTRGGNPFPPY
jgi:hypothetical protein